MKRVIGVGVLVGGFLVSACGSSTGKTPASSTGGTGSVGGSAGQTTGTGAGGSGSGSGSAGGSSTGFSGTVSTLAGSGVMNEVCGAWGKDLAFSPSMLALDANGIVYLGSDAVDSLSSSGTLGLSLPISHPLSGLAVTPGGSLFYAESSVNQSSTNLIYQVVSGASEIVFDYTASCADTDSDGGPPGLGEPAGIAVDPLGNVYVADEACYRVREFSPDSGIISTLSGSGNEGGKDGPGPMAEFDQLSVIAIDPNGNFYVAESDTGRIRKILADGTVSAVASYIYGVGGLAADAAGNVYFSSSQGNTIRMIDPGGHVTTIAGDGMAGYMDGPTATAEFNSPAGLAVDDQGNIYVADSANCYVRVIKPN